MKLERFGVIDNPTRQMESEHATVTCLLQKLLLVANVSTYPMFLLTALGIGIVGGSFPAHG